MKAEDVAVPIVVLDADRIITEANDAAGALVGLAGKELTGMSCYAAFRPRRPSGEDLLQSDWHPSALLRSTRRLCEQDVVIRHSDGTQTDVVVDGSYIRDADGSLQGAALFLRQKVRGPRRVRSGIRIVSTVSHELRSPLTSVRGFTSLLLKRWDDVGDSDRKEMLGQIDKDARRISRMIGELLEVSRIESGKVSLNRENVDLAALAASVIEKVKMGYPDLEASVTAPADMAPVWVDADRVEQVLTNLIENACKYASPVGIEVRLAEVADDVEVTVTDRGPGIPAADLPRLFQQFFRSKEGRPTGTGLGLWICRGLIEAHGGTLTASSTEGRGTVFRFTLPARAFSELHPS